MRSRSRSHARLTCRLCGQEHGPVQLAPGEKAVCVRCDTVLAQGSRLSPDAGLVFALTGLILAVPAAVLPFIHAGKLGEERTTVLFTGVMSLWAGGMRALALLVLFCGGIMPVLLLISLAVLHAADRFNWSNPRFRPLYRTARFLEHGSFPEVQVLAVFVALMKLGSLVDVTIGTGFWCYCGMAFSLVMAQHSFDFEVQLRPSTEGRSPVPAGVPVEP
jgi:paraquat-inducible protein A